MLKSIIKKLIDSKREGEYWDFKAKYHKNDAELLHDILCLSNNISNVEAYLIFGVADTGYIIGVKDDSNRKKQEELISFVNGKKFAAGRYPHVSIETFIIKEKEIDVVVINSSQYVPFYLEESVTDKKGGKEKKVNAGSIYTRVEDRNTPINSTASPLDTEKLWKIHFGLHPSPLKRLHKYLLDHEKWVRNSSGYFYSEAPEYIVYENRDIANEENYSGLVNPFYSYNQINSDSLYSYYEFKYHSTVLYSCQCISLDSGYYLTPTPELETISCNINDENTLYYRYFIEDTIRYNVHLFMFKGDSLEEKQAKNKFIECILIFKNDEEKISFENHILDNFDKVNQLINENKPRIYGIEDLTTRKQEYVIRNINTGKVLKDKLKSFRNKIN